MLNLAPVIQQILLDENLTFLRVHLFKNNFKKIRIEPEGRTRTLGRSRSPGSGDSLP